MPDVRAKLNPERNRRLHRAAADFFFLLNGSYPRKPALELTANRHDLDGAERMLLGRGVFSQREALGRRAKLAVPAQWRQELLAVDGHNVQITIESRLAGKWLLKANDGALRDIAGLSARYRMSETGGVAIDLVFAFLKLFPARALLFLFDEPMSRSGELAALYRNGLARAGLSGTAKTCAVPEREFPFDGCVVASSDRAVMDAARCWTDLARLIIDRFCPAEITADFSGFLLARSASNCEQDHG